MDGNIVGKNIVTTNKDNQKNRILAFHISLIWIFLHLTISFAFPFLILADSAIDNLAQPDLIQYVFINLVFVILPIGFLFGYLYAKINNNICKLVFLINMMFWFIFQQVKQLIYIQPFNYNLNWHEIEMAFSLKATLLIYYVLPTLSSIIIVLASHALMHNKINKIRE